MKRTLALLAIVPTMSLAFPALAQENVLRDHLAMVDLNTPPHADLFSVGWTNFQETSGVVMNSGRVMSGIIGDGQTLHSYSGFYIFEVPISGFLNFAAADFRLSFWSSRARMLSDPGLENPESGDRVFLFDTPSNPDWQTPIITVPGQWGPIGVYRFDFILDAAQVSTTAGALQYLSISPQGTRDDLGQAYSLPSLGGGIGSESGYVWFPFSGIWQPILWSDVPGFPYIGAADRITTIPAPGTAFGLLLAALALGPRRR